MRKAMNISMELDTILQEKGLKEMDIVNYQAVQKIAKDTIKYIETEIIPGMSLKEVRCLCENKMRELGADSFWYWDIGAFVFSGDETTVSVSGREYSTPDRVIMTDDIITIDLSPQVGDIWVITREQLFFKTGKSRSLMTRLKMPSGVQGLKWRKNFMIE